MKKRAKLHVLVALCVFLVFPIRGRGQSGPLSSPSAAIPPTGVAPTVEQILDRAVTASGGKYAWMRITSMHLKGSVEVSGATVGTFEKFDKAPNKSFERIDLGAAGVALQGFDGANGWKADPGQKPEDLQGDDLEDAKLDADFYGGIQIADLYPKLVLQGEAMQDGRNCYTVMGTPAHGTPRTFSFDKETGMLIGISGESRSAGKTVKVDSYFEDFKSTKGIQVPFTLRMKMDAATIVVHIHTVETNLVIMNTGFLKPANSPSTSVALSANSSVNQARPATGGVAGNTYTDRTYGFSYTYPAGWMPHGEATNREIMAVGRRMVSGQSAARDAATDAAFQRTTLLLSVFQYPLGTPGVKNENILVMVERVDFAPGIQTGQDYLRDMKVTARRSPIPYVFSNDIS